MVSGGLINWAIRGRDYEMSNNGSECFKATACSMLEARSFHMSMPGYLPTPLVSLEALAKEIGVSALWVKDESTRFGLNSFKSLGGSFAIGRWLCSKAGNEEGDLTYERIVKAGWGKGSTFVTATDGNHGRGVAWAARMMGAKAVVFMPHGAASARIDAIIEQGAEVFVTDANYDDAVRLASSYAAKNKYVLLQDTAWEGYDVIPRWIMQGYLTIISEAAEQIAGFSASPPTHAILQVGVGSFAASMIEGLKIVMKGRLPVIVIAEPDKAACLYESALSGSGKPIRVNGRLDTIMAGLACGEPNPIAYGLISSSASAFASCDDEVARIGMRILANPRGGDEAIVSGESGAVGAGLLYLIAKDNEYKEVKRALELDADSRVLLISTEGATDPEGYRNALEADNKALEP